MHAGWPRKAVGDTWTPMVNAASSLVDLWMAVTPKDLYLNTPCNIALLCDFCLHKSQLRIVIMTCFSQPFLWI